MTLLVALALAGIALLVAEVFLPGLVAGVLGVVCLLGAGVVGFLEFGPRTGSLILVAELLAGIVLVVLWMRYFPRTALGKKYTLEAVPPEPSAEKQTRWLGREGWALSDLRPAGSARFEGEKVDVLTQGEHIESGAPIRVVRVVGPTIFVRRV